MQRLVSITTVVAGIAALTVFAPAPTQAITCGSDPCHWDNGNVFQTGVPIGLNLIFDNGPYIGDVVFTEALDARGGGAQTLGDVTTYDIAASITAVFDPGYGFLIVSGEKLSMGSSFMFIESLDKVYPLKIAVPPPAPITLTGLGIVTIRKLGLDLKLDPTLPKVGVITITDALTKSIIDTIDLSLVVDGFLPLLLPPNSSDVTFSFSGNPSLTQSITLPAVVHAPEPASALVLGFGAALTALARRSVQRVTRPC